MRLGAMMQRGEVLIDLRTLIKSRFFNQSLRFNSIATLTVCYFAIYKGTTKVSILKISELLTVNKKVKL